MATPPIFVDADGNANYMDTSLWGELQYFIDLSMIYAKLPLAPFFRLRQVCKEWNRLASDHQFLEHNFKPPFSSNPYFVLPCAKNGRHTLLTLEGSSWNFSPVPQMQYEVSGLLYNDTIYSTYVFDLHTRVFHILPPNEDERDFNKPLVGMMVETSLIPYGFRVIISYEYEYEYTRKTRVYDSNSGAWTVKLSTRSCSYYVSQSADTFGVHYNNSMYFRVGDPDRSWFYFLTYDLEKDKWNYSKIGPIPGLWPYSKTVIDGDQRWSHNDMIGIWKDRWFWFAMNPSTGLVVWERHPKSENPWNQFDCMPQDLYQWMGGVAYCKNKVYGKHVLVYNCMGDEKRADLYTLDRKMWEKIELPASLVVKKVIRCFV